MRSKSTRSWLVWTTLAFGLSVSPVGPLSSSALASETTTTKQVAVVKVEIKQSNGKIVRAGEARIDWEQDANVRVESDGHVHDVALLVKKQDEKAQTLSVTLAYQLDGTPIIAPFEYDTKAKKREILRTDDGVAIAVTITPKTVKVKPQETEPGDKAPIEVQPGENPLDGLK